MIDKFEQEVLASAERDRKAREKPKPPKLLLFSTYLLAPLFFLYGTSCGRVHVKYNAQGINEFVTPEEFYNGACCAMLVIIAIIVVRQIHHWGSKFW